MVDKNDRSNKKFLNYKQMDPIKPIKKLGWEQLF